MMLGSQCSPCCGGDGISDCCVNTNGYWYNPSANCGLGLGPLFADPSNYPVGAASTGLASMVFNGSPVPLKTYQLDSYFRELWTGQFYGPNDPNPSFLYIEKNAATPCSHAIAGASPQHIAFPVSGGTVDVSLLWQVDSGQLLRVRASTRFYADGAVSGTSEPADFSVSFGGAYVPVAHPIDPNNITSEIQIRDEHYQDLREYSGRPIPPVTFPRCSPAFMTNMASSTIARADFRGPIQCAITTQRGAQLSFAVTLSDTFFDGCIDCPELFGDCTSGGTVASSRYCDCVSTGGAYSEPFPPNPLP